MKKEFSLNVMAMDILQIKAELASVADLDAAYVHVDIMDGHFAPWLTFSLDHAAYFGELAGKPVEVHLLIERPERYLAEMKLKEGDRVCIPVESTVLPYQILAMLREKQVDFGISLNPGTPAEAARDLLHDAQFVICQMREPGFSEDSPAADPTAKLFELQHICQEVGSRIPILLEGQSVGEILHCPPYADGSVCGSGAGTFAKHGGVRTVTENLMRAWENCE